VTRGCSYLSGSRCDQCKKDFEEIYLTFVYLNGMLTLLCGDCFEQNKAEIQDTKNENPSRM